MADLFVGYIRRIDFEPKPQYLNIRTFAHVFMEDGPKGNTVDFYTDDPRLEAVLLAGFAASGQNPPTVEVHYEDAGEGVKRLVQIALERRS